MWHHYHNQKVVNCRFCAFWRICAVTQTSPVSVAWYTRCSSDTMHASWPALVCIRPYKHACVRWFSHSRFGKILILCISSVCGMIHKVLFRYCASLPALACINACIHAMHVWGVFPFSAFKCISPFACLCMQTMHVWGNLAACSSHLTL